MDSMYFLYGSLTESDGEDIDIPKDSTVIIKNILAFFLLTCLLPAALFGGDYFSEITNQRVLIRLSQDIYYNQALPFNTYEGPGAFDSYLVMNVRYEPVKQVFGQITPAVVSRLISRGEAHITVITPPEFTQTLKSKLTMAEINQIARDMEIQKSRFNVLAVGSGKIISGGLPLETFFLIVQSEDLLQIRRRIQKAFVAKGGDQKAFDPESFYPHITVGFTKRDLHESDGVIKDIEHSLDPRFSLFQ
ncbi:MAG: 2'-5' RNA ligase family protein [Bdellovibrio sp.]|nr:2'-5' RNA ligase family protein [Bdellovibrio sp.]